MSNNLKIPTGVPLLGGQNMKFIPKPPDFVEIASMHILSGLVSSVEFPITDSGFYKLAAKEAILFAKALKEELKAEKQNEKDS